MGKADQSKEQAQSKSQHRAEREIKRRRATYIYIVRFIRICAIKQKQDSPHELSCLR